MKKIFLKEHIILIIFFGFSLIISAFIIRGIYPVHLLEQKPLFFDLIEFNFSFPFWFYLFINLVNIFLIWLLAKKFFLRRLALIPVLVYCLSPWSFYLMVSKSSYIYLLCYMLITALGILLIKSKKSKIGILIFILGVVLSLYSSLLMLIIYPIIITCLILSKFITFRQLTNSIFISILICLPLIFFMIRNQVGVKNIYHNQVTLFVDPGHLNAVNKFLGESSKAGLNFLARMGENKYLYLSKYLVLKLTKHLTPSTFFTPQERLLNFSFSPPIFLGFLIPFLYGLYLVLKSPNLRLGLIISLILLIPSIVSKSMVNLNRLLLYEPVMAFIISLGLVRIAEKKGKIYQFALFLMVILVITQFMVTIFDINFREYARYERYFKGALQIGEQ